MKLSVAVVATLIAYSSAQCLKIYGGDDTSCGNLLVRSDWTAGPGPGNLLPWVFGLLHRDHRLASSWGVASGCVC